MLYATSICVYPSTVVIAQLLSLLFRVHYVLAGEEKTNTIFIALLEIQYPWKKEEILGRGAFGVVFRARGPDGFEFAVKEGEENQQVTKLFPCLYEWSPNVSYCSKLAYWRRSSV